MELVGRSASQRVGGVSRAMVVAGVMSGDFGGWRGCCDLSVSPAVNAKGSPRVKVLGHRSFAYDKKLRAAVLAAMDAKATSAAELARLSWRLGEVYAECVAQTASELKLKPQLVACHGQTIYHQGEAAKYLGEPLRCTWQLGEAALIAEGMRVPVVSDFRPADMAAGGQAAPLVPMLDFCLFRHATKNRVLLNLGGIANVSALPAGASVDDVLAFDTGPSNMVIDACMLRLFGKRFDANGSVAARGLVLRDVVAKLMEAKYFSALPPKSCGREEYGEAFVDRFLAMCGHGAKKQDVIATATAFTAETVLDAYRRFCWPHLGQKAPMARATELFAAGGGTQNATLMRMLSDGFGALGVKVGYDCGGGCCDGSERGCGVCIDGLAYLAWAAGECSGGYWCVAGGGVG